MKKVLVAVLVMLFWCNVGFALTQDSAISQYLSDRKLEKIEGVWVFQPGGRTIVIYKSNNSYYSKVIWSQQVSSGSTQYRNMYRGSSYYFNAISSCYYSDVDSYGNITKNYHVECTSNLVLKDENEIVETYTYPPQYRGPAPPSVHLFRLWPEDFNSHNAKFDEKKEPKDKFTPSSGTAFFVTKKGHVITNFHVVEGCKDRSKIVYQDNEVKVKLIAKDKYLDLALLKADIENKHYIVISNKSPKKLQRIIAAGYPFGKELSDDLKFTSGIISSLKGLQDDSTRLQIDAALNYGNSGGPIVDEKTGELVAVAVAGLSKEVTESINFGIKAGSLKNFLDSNQINTSLLAKNFSFGNVDLSSILENATVYTFCN